MGFDLELIDVFQNGNISLKVYKRKDGTKVYWLFLGISGMEILEKDFKDLAELLNAYLAEG